MARPRFPKSPPRSSARSNRFRRRNWTFTAQPNDALIESINIGPAYLSDLATKVDLKKIRDANLSLAYDALHGSGGGYLDRVLSDAGIPATVLHTNRDVYFGGHHPEPADEQLVELKLLMRSKGLQLGLATDGDADRFGVMDEGGEFLYPNELIAMLVDYLVESRGWKGGVARTVATSHLVDRVAQLHGLELLETPVGFKFIGEYIKDGRIFLGGEESAGLSIRGHVPEKDGILACLLLAEMVASRRKSLKTQLKELFSRVGPVYNRRLNVRLDPSIQGRAEGEACGGNSGIPWSEGSGSQPQGRVEADFRRWKLGIDEAVGHGTGGEVLRGIDDPGRSGNAARVRKAMGQRKVTQGLVSRIAIGVFGLLTVAMILLAVFDERGALALGKRRAGTAEPQHGHRENHQRRTRRSKAIFTISVTIPMQSNAVRASN